MPSSYPIAAVGSALVVCLKCADPLPAQGTIMTAQRPNTLKQLRESGWKPKSVKNELRDNYLAAMKRGDVLFPGIVGYDDTVIPEISIAVLAAHDMLFLGEKGQAKSRLMRSLVRFLDEYVPYLDLPGCPIHEDPLAPITRAAKD